MNNQEHDERPVNTQEDMSTTEETAEQDIDELLLEEAPDFLASLKGIEQDKTLSAQDIELDDASLALMHETEQWRQSRGLKKLLFLIFPFAPRLSYLLKKYLFTIKKELRAIWVRGFNFSYYLWSVRLPSALVQLKKNYHNFSIQRAQFQREFKKLSWKAKLFAFSIPVLTVALVVFVFLGLTKKVFRADSELFLTGLDKVATQVYPYSSIEEMQKLYDNEWTSQNVILIEKIVVSLKRNMQSSENPMGAFEFIIEGVNPDILVKVKENEIPIRDFFQRRIEEFTFEELETAEGKRALLAELARELNDFLAERSIKAVRIKTIVLKH